MFTPDQIRIAVLLLAAAAAGTAVAQSTPNLGVELNEDEIAAWAITIEPDGTGLPDGSGTAVEGRDVYVAQCLACHGEQGEDGLNDRLAGGHGTLTDTNPVRTVGSYWPYATTIFDYVRRAMPFTAPQTLSDDEVYAVTAYLLYLNGIVEETDRIDAATLPEVEMPNRENFRFAYPDWQN